MSIHCSGPGWRGRRGWKWGTSGESKCDYDDQTHTDGYTADRLRTRSELAQRAERVQFVGISVPQLSARRNWF